MKQLYSPTWQESVISESSTIREAIRAIDRAGALMACVVDGQNRLLGILTDSDIRKLILAGNSIDGEIGKKYNLRPVLGRQSMSTNDLILMCEEFLVRELPILDNDGCLTDIFVWRRVHPNEMEFECPMPVGAKDTIKVPMFINAGGKGSRLASVVSDRPKPLAEVGGRPIISTIIRRANACGISDFFISVHHMADSMNAHLSQEEYAHLRIEVLREEFPLGTAGAIGFVSQGITDPLLVSNADVLTTVPYHLLVRHHLNQKADMTCAVFQHRVEVPFGVLELDPNELCITGIKEKPSYAYLANAGIYVLSPDTCKLIEKNKRLDMPELIQTLLHQGKKVIPFLLHEYWCDIGRPSDYHQANHDFQFHFGEH